MPLPRADQIPRHGRFTFANLRVPAGLIGRTGDLADLNLTVEGGRIVSGPASVTFDLDGAIVLPAFVDIHTHLDKAMTGLRAHNPDGSLSGAMQATAADRAHWSHVDLWTRMNHALGCAHVHGTRALRTHLDSRPDQAQVIWPLFAELRAEWAGRIDLQGATLLPLEHCAADGPFRFTAAQAGRNGGVLGALALPHPDLADQLDGFLAQAARLGLPVDFHADETLDPSSDCLRHIAEAVLRTGFDLPVTVGHCCSLATQGESEADATLDLVAEAGIGVVCLPLANLYLQDHRPGRTPRLRGITLVHEMQARGIPVTFASDNMRDPFCPEGDLDMVEILRESARIAHLDLADGEWPLNFATTAAEMAGFAPAGFLPGQPADFIVFSARSWGELLARPQADRLVVREGRALTQALPDPAMLDIAAPQSG